MTDTETLSSEAEAYFSSRGETVPQAAESEPNPAPSDDTPETQADDTPDGGAEPEVADLDLDADGEDTAPDAEKQNKQVPLRALTKTREELKAEKQRSAAIEAEAKVLRERWDQLLASQQPKAEEPVQEELDPTKDPLSALNSLLEERKQEKLTKAEQDRQAEEHRKQQEVWNQTLDVARGQFQAAAKEDASFEPLYTATRRSLATEYMELYGLSEQQAIAEVDNFEAQQIAYATQRGINVADHLRSLARLRNVRVEQAKQNDDPAAELERVEKGVSGSTSLSAASGGRTASVTRETIANMSPREFEAWLSKNGADGFRKLAGG